MDSSTATRKVGKGGPAIEIAESEKKSFFYRVQCHNSYTDYKGAGEGQRLISICPFDKARDLTKIRIDNHLAGVESVPFKRGTTFISVFDNFLDALKRAKQHYEKGDKRILIICIDASYLEKEYISNLYTKMPVWSTNQALATGFQDMWLNVEEVGPVLEIPSNLVRKGEWLVVGKVQRDRVKCVYPIFGNMIATQSGKRDTLDSFIVAHGGETVSTDKMDFGSRIFAYNWNTQTWSDRPMKGGGDGFFEDEGRW